MKYNQKRQGYTVEDRFEIKEENNGVVQYCRVKFLQTRAEQIVTQAEEHTGNFQDRSLLKKGSDIILNPEIVKTVVSSETATSIVETSADKIEISADIIDVINDAPVETVIEPQEVDTEVIPELDDIDRIHLDMLAPAEPVGFMAINPDGEEIHVGVTIEDFCELHDLDPEAVKACLEGTQKTHRKWRFSAL